MFYVVLMALIEKKTYAQWWDNIMAIFKKIDSVKCILPMCKMENFEGLLRVQGKSSITLSSTEVWAVHLVGKTSRFASSKRSVFFERRAIGLMWWPGLAFHGVCSTSFTLVCDAPSDDYLRRCLSGRLTGEMYSWSRLLVKGFGSFPRGLSWLVRFR